VNEVLDSWVLWVHLAIYLLCTFFQHLSKLNLFRGDVIQTSGSNVELGDSDDFVLDVLEADISLCVFCGVEEIEELHLVQLLLFEEDVFWAKVCVYNVPRVQQAEQVYKLQGQIYRLHFGEEG